MKSLLAFAVLFVGFQAHSATLECQAAHGSKIVAQIDAQENLSQISYKSGQGELVSRPGASGMAILGQKLKVVGHFKFTGVGSKYVGYASINDEQGNMLAIVNNGKSDSSAFLADGAGYGPATCSVK